MSKSTDRSGHRPPAASIARAADLLEGQSATVALVGERRAGEPIDDYVPAGDECRLDQSSQVLSTRSEHEVQLRSRCERAQRPVEEEIPNSLAYRAPTRFTAQLGADRGGQQRGLRGFPDAFAAFDRDQPARSTHGSKVRASRSAARLLVATRSPSAAQACDGAIPLSLSTTSVMASSCEARCFWISIASCKTASASL